MKKLYILLPLVAYLLVFGVNRAYSAVCFAADGACGGAASFDKDYEDPAVDAKEQCIEAGFSLATECTPDAGKQIAGYCPYSSEYVTCCGLEYAYSSCSYPLIQDAPNARCGNKYKCKCDPVKYKFNIEECSKGYFGTRPAGGTCVQQGYKAGEGVTTDIFYSDCICDVGTYPYASASEIGGSGVGKSCLNNSDLGGEVCKGTDGVSRYASCICNRSIYKYMATACEFGGDDTKLSNYCIQGGLYYFKTCFSCDAFPANSLDNVAPGGEGISYTKCTYGERYKITKCIKGFRPGENGGNCRKINCLEAIDEWLTDYPLYKGSYTLLASTSDISKYGLQSATSNQDDIGTASAKKSVIIASEKISLSKMYAGVSYYGGGYFGKLKGGYLKDSCKTITYDGMNKQSKPDVTYTYSGEFYYPTQYGWNFATRGYVYMYGIKFSTYSLNTLYGLYFVNTDVNLTNFTVRQNVDYAPSMVFNSNYYEEGYEEKPLIKVSNLMTLQSYFSSSGYGYDVYRMNLEVPSSYRGREFARFTLTEGQGFRVSYMYMYPTSDSPYINYGSYVQFFGPSGDVPANIYSNVYVGTGPTNHRARGMSVRISGHLNWNMYDSRGNNYKITLSPSSTLYSLDYGGGNYARIKRGVDSKWGYCTMAAHQPRTWKHRWWVPFSCDENNRCIWGGDGHGEEDFISCSVDKNDANGFYDLFWYNQGYGYSSNSNVCPPGSDSMSYESSSCSMWGGECGKSRLLNCVDAKL